MPFVQIFKYMRFLPLLALPFLAWLLPPVSETTSGDFSSEKVNLALRRTADGLLRAMGDSTSRIPAIEHADANTWRVRLDQPFQYEQLPGLLQASLELHGIRRPYEVAIRDCSDGTIDLGYHQADVVYPPDNGTVPCSGRDMPEGCHYIEVEFSETSQSSTFWAIKYGVLLLAMGGIVGFWFARRQKPKSGPVADAPAVGETDWLEFGHSRLDVSGQILVCAGVSHPLTFRETKLLRLFASNPDRLLERDEILRQVWADEGVLVGRSVDVFVSRLRKKLAGDGSLGIVAVHGVGYRLETGK
jgi:hypothetical protein